MTNEPTNAARRNLAAEERAVEEGHRAFVQDDGSVLVVSDTFEHKRYRVTFTDAGTGIVFRCTPQGHRAFEADHLDASAPPGVVCCKHAAVAARRLERERLAEFTSAGVWRALAVKPAHVHEFVDGRCSCGEPEDPFDGLPS